ncbi:GyrI-like domain-containing protein [Actinotalea sp. K2]|uniref:GyrI-like domain-containing protein n=1 Tax=Actinotalea sp. K2 TaxID=2939438 RepID=UPI00201833C4|nr:GyrI-like domain-containing protein [Actinotalea sp. K2]MCL3859426.1 GyrI-like domain-containing protein [Actinotalea sp. K2]
MSDAGAMTRPELTTITAVDTAVVRGVVPTSDLPSFFDRSFAALGAQMAHLGVTPTGPAFAYYSSAPGTVTHLEVGFPVDGRVEGGEQGGDVVASRLPGGRVATAVHQGGYEGLGQSWLRLLEWVAQQGLSPAPGYWEVYLTEPTPGGDPATHRTALYLHLPG